MAKVTKVVLAFALLLSLNVILSAARPGPDWEDDDLFKSSEEEEEEVKESEKGSRTLGNSPVEEHPHGHDHHTMQNSNANLQSVSSNNNDNEQMKAGSWGGNVSNFNESCEGTSGKICNTNTNLNCVSNICKCLPAHIYVRSQEKCYPITKGQGNCEFNDQCHQGKWGYFSRCERTTGRCQCYDIDLSGKREVAYIDETCVLKKNVNDPCENDRECQGTMKDNAYCAPRDLSANPSWTNATQVCQCKPKYIWDNLLSECLRIADEGLASDCKTDLQCQTTLGENSRCSRETKKCECWDFKNPGQDQVVFYKPNQICYGKKYWNNTCTVNEECKASISSEAECLPQTDLEGGAGGTMLLTCQCPEGKKCPLDADGDGAVGLSSSTFNIAILISFLIYYGFRY